MTYVDTRMSVWDALAGRAPGEPLGPADPELWGAVVDRLNPARARPVLRAGIEAVGLTSARGTAYVMLRSPDDGGRACYLRLTPEEWQLALMMDGGNTVARLVAEFARLAGRLSPDQVRRVVADLAANRMLDDLPLEAFRPAHDQQRAALPAAPGATGRRSLVFAADRLMTTLHRAGGRFFFGRAAAIVLAVFAVTGIGLFGATWWRGSQSVFLTNGSYLLGAVVLLLLNVVAVACHELGHAMAVKHAGREVPVAGFSLAYGIPSFFVDTTDAWMAGRRARLLVTASGPATALVLAGTIQLVGLAVPALGPLAFKLAFLWYLNVLFNLNPFLALDGSYLLMDWLEIPGLRGRGLAWLSARLRGRGPAWRALDREGKLVALYGVLAVLWVLVAVDVAWRLWSDRLTGLATGLWHDGFGGKLLLLLVLLGLGAPLVCLAGARVARWWRRSRLKAAEKRREEDAPRRLAALRNSDLGGLAEPALADLAARARWMRPSPGTQMVTAGSTQQAVYVVVDGAMQARKPGDPGGTIRHHVGAGGVVGLANALTGRSTALDWHTAGTTLLAVPTATVASVIGPLPGPPPGERAEAEALFADTPALSGLAGDERLALIASAHPLDLEPGAPVDLPGPTHAVVVESGVIAMPDGVELRRGTLIGPVGDGSPGTVAQTRTPTRLWVIPDASDLPPLVGDPNHVPGGPGAGTGGVYPPLAAPPGPPEGTGDDADRRFERRMWLLVLLLTLTGLLVTAVSFVPGPAWAEMPANRALLTSDEGALTTTVRGATARIADGDRRYVEPGASLTVPAGATGRLTFPGGAVVLLCGGSQVDLGELGIGTGREQTPHGLLTVRSGRVLADTGSTSGAYEALTLTVARASDAVTNDGAAWYAVDSAAVTVATGRVYVAGTVVMAGAKTLTCGDGVPVEPPAAEPSDGPAPSSPAVPAPSPSRVPSSAPTSAPPVLPVPTGTTTAPRPTSDPDRTEQPDSPRPTTNRPTFRPPSPRPTTARPTTTPPSTRPTTTPPPAPDPSSPEATASAAAPSPSAP
ncbi:M50 family metallopeptidase [Actinoplanes sp. N902-109]|uniref:M50 family metallopeptidase n=1 Tax=Actinoplanes sp. (strain N902-109) TaxID=649831 RepID=UPI0003295508|nr:M50 family metallopeptidase [Actinoplanes sp. N902-109]AGL20696.1 cyclic nucleotide-binding protein [Actinoplanes sp. N902-109]